MWRYQTIPFQPRFLLSQCIHRATRGKHGQGSSLLSRNSYTEQYSLEESTHWFLNSASFEGMRSNNLPQQAIRELKSFDEFGLLSSRVVNFDPQKLVTDAPFMDKLLSYDGSSVVSSAVIPTTADPSELGGSSESVEIEQLEELIDQGFDVSSVLRDMSNTETEREPSTASFNTMASQTVTAEQTNTCSSPIERLPSIESVPSSSEHPKTLRFDPDLNRKSRATVQEVLNSIQNQDLVLLRYILMEKKWPDHRSIGAHLDRLFELIIRESYDIDEAVMFLQDFALSNRRGFLHDVNGIRLALRAARDSGSVSAALEMLRVFRNMFLVKCPVVSKSSPAWILEEFYTTLCSLGLPSEVESVHKAMLTFGFDKNSDIFIRAVTSYMLKKSDIKQTFDEWRRLSLRYGTTCASEVLWEGLFTSVDDRAEQARLADKLLAHCRQHNHPFAVISNLVMALIRMKHLDAAKAVLTKIAIPGRFLKKPLSSMAHYEDSLEFIENFAALITECMFSEKRRTRETKTCMDTSSSVITPELSSVLDSFCGMGRPKQQKLTNNDTKRKLHRVNDEQLFELSECLQSLWLEKAEKINDVRALDRLISWSSANRLEIPSYLTKRIVELKSNSRFHVTAQK